MYSILYRKILRPLYHPEPTYYIEGNLVVAGLGEGGGFGEFPSVDGAAFRPIRNLLVRRRKPILRSWGRHPRVRVVVLVDIEMQRAVKGT